MSAKLELGSVVIYKGIPWLALQYDGDLVKIINPAAGNVKLNVAKRHLRITQCTPAHGVNYNGKRHLVTKHGTIISMVSLRVLKNTTKDAKAILNLAEQHYEAIERMKQRRAL